MAEKKRIEDRDGQQPKGGPGEQPDTQNTDTPPPNQPPPPPGDETGGVIIHGTPGEDEGGKPRN